MIHLFCGYDRRESVGFHTFVHSVIERSSAPVSIVPLSSMGLLEGSNAFTLSRFLVPQLMRHKGRAIFVDASDMLMRGDIAELDGLFNPEYAVQVVKHKDYKTKHKVKYIGTCMECPNLNYERKNWASVMLINCEHPAWKEDDYRLQVQSTTLPTLQFRMFDDSIIGELPGEWNRLVDEGQEWMGAKILHWTTGIPGFKNYQEAPAASEWVRDNRQMLFAA